MQYHRLKEQLTQDTTSLIDTKNYDLIISDTKLRCKYKDLTTQGKEEILSYTLIEKKKILLILEHTLWDNIVNLLVGQENITIIELNSGIYAHGIYERMPRISPYSLKEYNFEIYNPIDQKNLKIILNDKINQKKYIQIGESPLPETLTTKEELPILINFSEKKNPLITLLCIGECYIQVGQAIQDTQSAQLLVSDTITLNEKTLTIIKNTEVIMIAIDTQRPEIIEKEIQAQLYKNQIFNKKIKIISPNYNKLNTIIKEYQLEESEFDTESIRKNLGI